MRPNDVLVLLLREKEISKAEFARQLGISRGTLQERLRQKNISTQLLNEMLRAIDYELVVQPITRGARKTGQLVVD